MQENIISADMADPALDSDQHSSARRCFCKRMGHFPHGIHDQRNKNY